MYFRCNIVISDLNSVPHFDLVSTVTHENRVSVLHIFHYFMEFLYFSNEGGKGWMSLFTHVKQIFAETCCCPTFNILLSTITIFCPRLFAVTDQLLTALQQYSLRPKGVDES